MFFLDGQVARATSDQFYDAAPMTMLELLVEPHPLLDLAAFSTAFATPLGQAAPAPWITTRLMKGADAPFHVDDSIRAAVRKLLRHGGYKPSGRGKPASEYLWRAAERGTLASINPAVDACNVVSLHSGLPVSVIDLDRARPPMRVAIAPEGARYVFNASGQEIDLQGLLCLHDANGPCANAVKDAQRTKTRDQTVRTLSLVWGSRERPDRTEAAVAWYMELLRPTGASVSRIDRLTRRAENGMQE
jgi:DNA/RNA-binding domain of Phe-tRNA-synthetase-like protein